MKYHNRLFAFTLSEILITLGIIGVVAALTISSLVGKYQKLVTAEKLKQSYSLLANAFVMAENDYGSPESWDAFVYGKMNISEIVEQYIRPYLKNAQYLGEKSNVEVGYKSGYPTFLSGSQMANSVSYTIISPQGYIYRLRNQQATIDGNMYNSIWIAIDINGLSAPNKNARDVFYAVYNFGTTKDSLYKFTMLGFQYTEQQIISNQCNKMLSNA